ncbi:AAA family ATPase [Burkholderia diffusa]|uniref:AAA family ATPase n=1 Tax=Burkholderia diffusa TaxID=488732 RepID=UPI00157B0BAD|nr:ATP-binding protein [Burkholderia diffusa]
MARYTDGTGYLLEMRSSVQEAWFFAVCDIAINSRGDAPSEEDLQRLWNLFLGVEGYTSTAPVAPPVFVTAAAQAAVFLEELAGFAGFRKLSPGLSLRMGKQVTLIFGRNGAGKSSICQALKVLANRDAPITPLHNAHARPPRAVPAFTYRFRGATAKAWNAGVGYGVENNAIKYFDSTIAVKHATGALDVEATVEVVAFRLEVFDFARSIITAFQAYVSQRITAEKAQIQQQIDALRAQFSIVGVPIAMEPFASWSPTNFEPVSMYLNELPPYSEQYEALEATQRARHATLAAATSEEGLRALRAQSGLLVQLEQYISGFLNLCSAVDPNTLLAVTALRAQKHDALMELSRTAFPAPELAAHQQTLIDAAAKLVDFRHAGHGVSHCPLCRQELSAGAVDLFRTYHEYLVSTLKGEIDALTESIQTARGTLAGIGSYTLRDFSACQPYLPDGFIPKIIDAFAAIIDSIPKQPDLAQQTICEGFARWQELVPLLQTLRENIESINNAVHQGTGDRQALVNELSQVNAAIAAATAHRAIDAVRADILRSLNDARERAAAWSSFGGYRFQGLFAAMTNKGKEAHTELVRDAFEQRLSAEYVLLAGTTLAQMGINLKSIGERQDVVVSPVVGDEPVHRVLSEGEQKVHALAVFFCEATTTPHRVLVLDDPVTSFDYNYVSNLCERVRDLARDQPDTQILILTHNWDFFANLQSVFGRSNLSNRMSVQVLENCATVEEYHDKWDELTADIGAILNAPAEPSAEDKERLSGLMRRLIERLTNSYVFNEQRHQYKNKSLPVSEFQNFTKIVPLTQQEANELRDLYANLSPAEHDDIRNFYASKTRTQFEHWYAGLVAIRDALLARRP